jgi:hypothetical protein
MNDSTARHALPLIAPGQAQKEVSHNEALAALDLLVQPAVSGVGVNVPPDAPVEGECWIVGPTPSGAWSGHTHALAGWTAGGWRFAAPREGMAVWIGGTAGCARYTEGAWVTGTLHGERVMLNGVPVVGAQRPAIASPTGGATVDAEARAALGAVLAALRTHGLIAT